MSSPSVGFTFHRFSINSSKKAWLGNSGPRFGLSIFIFLLHSDKIVVLLAALYEEVLAVDEVVGGDDLVKGCEFLLVERYAAALYELAHFALAGENLDIAPALLLWDRGKVAELVYRLTLIDWEPIRAIIISSEAEMDAWPFMALISPSFIPLML